MKKWSTKEPKFWKVMRACAVQTMLAMALFGASIAHDGAGQVLDKRITLEMKDATLQSVLEKIEREAGVKFIFNPSFFNFQEKVTISSQDATLKDVLKELFESRRIEYHIYEKEQAITLRKARNETGEAANEQAAKYASTITGRVTGGSPPEALAGVNVIIRGTTVGTTTDASGYYTIQGDDNNVLIFSFIGFQTYETQISGRSTIDVVLVEDSKNLKEVVVNAGYWEVETKVQTGNISRLTASQIETQPVTNALQAMQGRLAGVQVTTQSGIPGDGVVVQVRGINSLRGIGANEPLYIVDGVPFSSQTLSFGSAGTIVQSPSPLNSINPADIQSIDVLKDADATAVYGSRGANGVVLITTKKGKAGKTQFDVNVYTGGGTALNSINLLNTPQYVRMRKEAFRNDGIAPTVANAPDLMLWDTTRYTNWKKLLTGNTATITSAQGTISGGNTQTQFTFGGGYFRQTSVFAGDYNYQKGSSHMSLRHAMPNEKFVMQLTATFSAEKNLLPTSDYSLLALTLAPNAPALYDQSGNLNWENGTWSNPYAELRKTYEVKTKTLVTNATLSYTILPGLNIKSSMGYNLVSLNEVMLTPIAAQNPALNPLGSANSSGGSINTWILEPQADYQKQIGEGKLTVLAGMTFQQTIRDKQGFNATGFTSDSQLRNIAAATTVTPSGIDYSEYKYNAAFGRLNYTWREKYIVNITARRDGSSRFGPNRRFANFGAVGAAWIFSKETFFPSAGLLSYGKLRGSFGVTGSDQIGDYQYLDTYSSTTNPYQGGKGILPTRLYNPDFGWEDNAKLEFGLDLGFFHDRLSVSSSYFSNRSSNQLVGLTLPLITGFNSVQSNLPATIRNTGVEVVITSSNVRTSNLSWTTDFNVSILRNKLVEYPNIDASSYANTYKVGEPLTIQKKYVATGVDPQTGIYTFVDTDNNGSLNSITDTQFNKSKQVDFFGGIQNTVTYKGFELQFFIQFVKQTGFNYMMTVFQAPGARSNQPTLVMDRWQKPGDVTDIQRFTQTAPALTAYSNARIFGDNTLTDASFIRLQNASLTWTMPQRWSGKIKTQKVRLFVRGQNLLTITNYVGSDPETQNMRALTPLRMWTAGANITF